MLLRRSLYFTEISLCLTSLQFLHPARWYRSLFSSSVRSKNSSLHLHISAGYQHPQNCIRGLSLLTLHTSESESGERPRPPEWSSLWPHCWGRGLWARLWQTSRLGCLYWPDLLERLSISCLFPATHHRLWDCRDGMMELDESITWFN